MKDSGLSIVTGTHSGVKNVTRCQGCLSAELDTVSDLGHQPLVHALLRKDQLELPETTYPLRLLRCRACGLVLLGHVVDPGVVFPEDYPYLTSLTPVMRINFREMAKQAKERLALQSGDLAVDIGSNDGTLLDCFRELGLRVLGVEPTGISKVANQRGIPSIQKFFSENVAREIVSEHGKARVVTATNVIGHIEAIDSVLRGIASLLTDDGVFVSESHYLLDLIHTLQYDTIYHEHLRFYSVRPFAALLRRLGFYVIDVQRLATHGGSIRVWAVANAGASPHDRVAELLRAEEQYGLYTDEVFLRFRKRVIAHKHRLLEMLLNLKKDGARIVGIGGPARANTLLNTCHIDADILDYIREQDHSLKVGLYMPGSHIPVVGEQRLYEEQPEYALVLSWHIAEEVMRHVRNRGYRGRFIVPLPEPAVLGQS